MIETLRLQIIGLGLIQVHSIDLTEGRYLAGFDMVQEHVKLFQ